MKVGLFGCGAYGMALSSILIENNCDVTMWTKFEEEKKQLEETRQNERLIPNFKISEKINGVLDEISGELTEEERVEFYRSLTIISNSLDAVARR